MEKSPSCSTSLYYLCILKSTFSVLKLGREGSVTVFSLVNFDDIVDKMVPTVIHFIILGVISGELLLLDTADKNIYSFIS